MKKYSLIVRCAASLLALFPLCAFATTEEIAFAIQGSQVTWFEVADPSMQGNISVTGLPANFDGNGLAYDSGLNRLLFVNSDPSQNHVLYSLSLTGFTYQPGMTISAGPIGTAGTIHFATTTPGLYGADFYNGSYYSLRDGTSSLVKVNFDGSGNITTFSEPTLPGSPTPYLGDIAFNSTGNLYMSGDNAHVVPDHAHNRFWHYSTTDGTTFTSVPPNPIQPADVRWNGLFFSLNGTLYGYRLGNDTYGTINLTDGSFTTLYTGGPFVGGGDLAPGFLADIVTGPPPVPDGGSTLALLGLSLGLLGIVGWRKKISG